MGRKLSPIVLTLLHAQSWIQTYLGNVGKDVRHPSNRSSYFFVK